MKRITIIAPMYNEENLINEYVKEVFNYFELHKEYEYELLLVNDGSNDNTLSIMIDLKKKYKCISIISLSRNFGLEGAIFAGLSKAQGDAVITMDADLQDSPKVFSELIKKWKEGYKVVNAKRIARKHDSFFKRSTAAFYYKLLDKLSGKLKIDQNVANFRLLDRECVDTINSLRESNKIYRVLVPFIGYKSTCIDYERDKRYSGVTKYNLGKLIYCAIDGLTNITIIPLYCSLFFSVLIFIIFLLSIVFKLVFAITISNTALFVFNFVLAFVFFINLFIISMYISQIFIESKKRPLFIIEKYISSGEAYEF